jgi:hypothetical protein
MHHSLLHGGIAASLVLIGLGTPAVRQARPAAPPSAVLVSSLSSTLPIVAEHHYRMAAKIRPLLLFWMGRDNVGGARIVWRRGPDATRGWELLIGSDPTRAPAHVNRWGYIREEGTDAGVSMLGVMKQSDEESLDEARTHVENASNGGYFFKLIRTRVAQGQSSAVVASGGFPRDYTYRDLAALLDGFASLTAGPTRQIGVGQNTKPGFLIAVADLIHDATSDFHRSGAAGLARRTVTYAYNGRLYDLTLQSPHVLKNARYGDRTYPTLVEGDFEIRNRADGAKQQFSVVFGTDGAIEEVPVYIAYQPRWWFKAELLLDENQRF